MQEYFLVIDTETSGLPKIWDKPYDAKNNWPFILQIAWIIFDAEGTQIKKENHYIKPGNFNITKSSIKIHQITKEVLANKGKDKLAVIKKLGNDVAKYNPLVVAHFAELDFHMVGVESFRLNIENPLINSPLFCTMKASVPYIKNPNFKYLKLNRFYKTLFNRAPNKLHDALNDAQYTSEVFFHLLKKGEVTDQTIAQQKEIPKKVKQNVKATAYLISGILLILLILLLLLWNRN